MLQTKITISEPTAAKLNKANARDVAKARAILRTDDGPRMYAASLSAIHRSSSRQQQLAIESVIAVDGAQELFRRHPANGCLLSAYAA